MTLFIFLVGLALASFIGSLSYRSHRHISIVSPPSFCPDCGTRLSVVDLVPVASYILLRGRCRYCGSRIPVQYPAVEVLLPVVLVFLYRIHGASLLFFCQAYLVTVLLYLALLDLDAGSITVPEGCTVYAGSGAYIALILRGLVPGGVSSSLYGLAAATVLIAISAGAVFLMKKKMPLGAGDLLVLPGVSLYFGPEEVIRLLIFSSVLGLIAGAVVLLRNRSGGEVRFPFLPCLAGGVCIEFLFI